MKNWRKIKNIYEKFYENEKRLEIFKDDMKDKLESELKFDCLLGRLPPISEVVQFWIATKT